MIKKKKRLNLVFDPKDINKGKIESYDILIKAAKKINENTESGTPSVPAFTIVMDSLIAKEKVYYIEEYPEEENVRIPAIVKLHKR